MLEVENDIFNLLFSVVPWIVYIFYEISPAEYLGPKPAISAVKLHLPAHFFGLTHSIFTPSGRWTMLTK